MSFIYGILYLSLTAYSITFGQIYGFSPGVSGLPYIGTIIGIVAGFLTVAVSNPRYVRALRANDNVTVPEWRLVLPMAGAISFTGGLFFFGWTAYTGTIHWVAPTAAGVFLGFGIYTVFLQLLNYIIDSYLTFAASAIAANTFLRSLFGAVFPLFATQMYNGEQQCPTRRDLKLFTYLFGRCRHRNQLEDESTRLRLDPPPAFAFHLLCLWQENPLQIKVRVHAGL